MVLLVSDTDSDDTCGDWQLSDYGIQEHCIEEELPPKKIKKEVLVIAAKVNGDLCGFLELCSRPNLAAIA